MADNAPLELNEEQKTAYNALMDDLYSDVLSSGHKAQIDQAQHVVTNTRKVIAPQLPKTNNIFEKTDSHDITEHALFIDGDTARAVQDKVMALRNEHRDLVPIEKDFVNVRSEARMLEFLRSLQKQQREQLGVDQNTMQSTLLRLYAINETNPSILTPEQKEIMEVGALEQFMSLVTQGRLPSGTYTTEIHEERPWVLPKGQDATWDHDRFFPESVYAFTNATGHSVPASSLFSETNYAYNPEAYQRVLDAAKEVGIPTDDPNAKISTEQLGEMAKHIMLAQAKENWCHMDQSGEPFDQSKITEMIHNKQFMPHADDMYLVERGLGMPDHVQKAYNTIKPEESFMFFIINRDEIMEHQKEEWAQTFGRVDGHDKTPAREYQSYRGFASSTNNNTKTRYEMDRDKYLESIKDATDCTVPVPENDCIVDAGPCKASFDPAAQPIDKSALITENIASTCIVDADSPCNAPSAPVIEQKQDVSSSITAGQ